MPGRDEQAALKGRPDFYLAAKTSLGPSSGFQGILFIWLLWKDCPVPRFPPSLPDRPPVSSAWKLHKKKPPFCYFIPKPSEVEIARGNLSICYPSAQQWMEFITLCILPPASARQPVGWSMGGEGGSHHREGAIALAAASIEVETYLLRSERQAVTEQQRTAGRWKGVAVELKVTLRPTSHSPHHFTRHLDPAMPQEA